MDLIGWFEFLAILGSIIVVPILWMVLRGEKSGDWEGEYWEKKKLADVRALTQIAREVVRPIWIWGAERYLRLLRKRQKNQRRE